MNIAKTFLATLTLLVAANLSSATAASTNDYRFRPQYECTEPNHGANLKNMAEIEDKLVGVVSEEKNANLLQQAWMKVLRVKDEHSLDGSSDVVFVYKNYPHVGMLVAFKDGCFVGYKVFPLDVLNKIITKYLELAKGV